jgi:hypothetical protein
MDNMIVASILAVSATERSARSALPDAPVVPDRRRRREPGDARTRQFLARSRQFLARGLGRLAGGLDRLARSIAPPLPAPRDRVG